MSRKNDFHQPIKIRLAERAGYKCCYLGCGQATTGPSKENNNTGKSNTGNAAHIYSASFGKGARRVPPKTMTTAEIINLKNGVWMCETHARYIDTDETTFTADQLTRWKEIGEKIAEEMQKFRCSYIQALAKLEHIDPKISTMIAFAQKYDLVTNRYDTLDFLLYKKILKMLPKSVISCAREGFFTNRHQGTLRDKINIYLHESKSQPIDFSFHNKIMQDRKKKMDQALSKLADYLSTSTFWESIDNKDYYAMNPRLKLTDEGLSFFINQVDCINEYSVNFIKAFDSLYEECRDYFLK